MLVSIIIPTLNRATVLSRTLRSVAALDLASSNLEILVVDNGSTDGTQDAFDAAQSQAPGHRWRYFRESMPGLLSGRHRGALESEGDICAFIDDDVRLDVNWLNVLKEVFDKPEVVLAGGPSRPLFELEPPEWLQGFYHEDEQARFCGWLSLLDGGDCLKEISPMLIWGLNYIIRKKSLFELGGFHPDCVPKSLQRFQGDGETGLSLKIRETGAKAMYHPQISVQHEIPASRLTPRYFQDRAYFQGVCDSYTKIRTDRCVHPPRGKWKAPLRVIKKQIKDIFRPDKTAWAHIKAGTVEAYQSGYNFHHEEVLRDPVLLEWVLRADYWDYALPIGKESKNEP